MKKILILTITAGNGHNACARGMKRKLEEAGDCEVRIVDMLKTYSTKLVQWFSNEAYSLVVSKLPFAYNAFYENYINRPPNHRYSTPSQNTVLSITEGLLKEILEFQPDVVYSTHFYGSMATTNLKLVYDLPFVDISAALDYVLSPFWESGIGVDHFIIPNEDFIDYAIYKGYKKEQLMPIGLPVDGRSLDKSDKKEARKALGLDEDTFTVMVMFGGGYWNGGYKIFKDLVKALKGRKAQIIMVNGKNEKSFKKTAKTKLPDGIKVLNVGFTSEVPLYMSAADIILNKFGGTSVTEMINKELPMLITEKIAAQEKHNLVYMKEKGVALSFKNAKTLKQNVLKLMDDPDLRRSMSEKTVPLKKNAIDVLAELILSQPKADYTELLKQDIDFKTVEKTVRKALKKADKAEKKKPNPVYHK
ncbi:MAG: hypothetical protein K2K80_08375 [Clostridia bacterium]|nr:hypothetical protein [Clostridia bacterium]